MTYRIDADKLAAVVALFNEQVDPSAEDHIIEREICTDWNDDTTSQAWIDDAEPQEIVDWLASCYE